jgi:serine/threonine protein kinase
MSDREHDERVMSVLTRVMKLNPDEREAYVRLACNGNQRLYEEVTEAVAWEQRMGGFLQEPLFRWQKAAHVFEPGQVISDRFEVIRELGEGGMGVVYEAFDRKRKQRIAIKSAKPGFHHLLSPEIDGALRVRHPNVCLVNEIHTAHTAGGDVDFLTMELLKGQTLAARIAESGRLAASEAIDIARQLCSGLRAAHHSGVVHGDLKAENIILCGNPDGSVRPVITDFGLSGDSESNTLRGTPRYMAPELWLGQKPSRASDIYALGVILYEMVVGNVSPAVATSGFGVHTNQIPRSYSRIVEGCLNIQPERRSKALSEAFQLWCRERMPWQEVVKGWIEGWRDWKKRLE